MDNNELEELHSRLTDDELEKLRGELSDVDWEELRGVIDGMKDATEEMKKIKSDTEATIRNIDSLREKLEKKSLSAEAISQEMLDEMSLNNAAAVAYIEKDKSLPLDEAPLDYDEFIEQFKKDVRAAYDKTDKTLSLVDFLEQYNK